MVGGICVLNSPMVDSYTSPCVCLVALASTRADQTSNRDLNLRRKLVIKKMSSSFMGSGFPAKAMASKKQKRITGLVIVNNLGGQYEEDGFDDVKGQIFNLFTLTAVRTIMSQLYEMNPTQYQWFYDYVRTNKPTNGKRFLHLLQKENHELAERVMVTRLHLFAKWVKELDHAKMYNDLSDQNLELMRERLLETVKWPTDDNDRTNTDVVG
ncbi:chaperonin-like RbcX protein 2, chloroplastic [Bidens hawaiensis]|uniref:chaperonin-like RbcX protein 2, chloroplastic n=1 Tax=Bidens hawaiensis TaxID=980011 RepID=UPI00404B81DA